MTQRSNQSNTARAAVSAATPRTSIIDRAWESSQRSTPPLRVAVPRPSASRVASVPPPLPRQDAVRVVSHAPPPPVRAPRAITLNESDFMEDTDAGLKSFTRSAPPPSAPQAPRRRWPGAVAALAVASVAIAGWVGLPHLAQGISVLNGPLANDAPPAFLRSSASSLVEGAVTNGPKSNVRVLATLSKPGRHSQAANAEPAKVKPATSKASSKKAKAQKARPKSPSRPAQPTHGGKL
jgi:hypothetical protein